MKRLLIALLLALAPCVLHAQAPYVVQDINTTMTTNPASSSPTGFFRYGSHVLYAGVSAAGYRLWSTDGTAAGTHQVTDPAHGNPSNPSGFVELNGKVIFNGTDDQHGEELWTTDGTAEGTRLLADIRPGFSSSSPGARIVYRGKLYFVANDGLDGISLWVTDGSPAGTQFFKNASGGTFGAVLSAVVLNDILYFSMNGPLWKSDGTADGTVLVAPSVSANNLVVAGSRIFFNGYTTNAGTEPWVSDGTEAGTHLLADIETLPGRSSVSFRMVPFGDRVLFSAFDDQHGSELWISDGTASGTRLVRDIAPGPASSISVLSLVTLGGTAYFSALTTEAGAELWKTDGTEAGTMLLGDLSPGKDSSSPGGFLEAGDRFYFAASSSDGSRPLWVSDGTAGGTRPVKTSGPSLRVGVPVNNLFGDGTIINFDGVLLFSGWSPLNGYELWRSDGTDSGTSMVVNAASDAPPSADPQNVTAAADWVYFDAWDGSGSINSSGQGTPRSLWRSDGTSEGTVKLVEFTGATYVSPGAYIPYGRSLLFTKDGQWWMTDGTPQGTRPATALASRFPQGATIAFILGDTLFARANISYDSDILAASLTSEGPAVRLGITGYGTFLNVAGRALIIGSSIWSTDGTRKGTWTVAPDVGGSSAVVMGGTSYFVSGNGLWKTDGTFEGTAAVKSFTANTNIGSLTVAGRSLFFTQGGQLAVTDGTEAGTHTLPATPLSNVPLAVAGDRVVFAASDPATGTELWVSDGTVDGTRLLRDFYPGSSGTTPNFIFSSSPSNFTAVGGQVYFSAADGVYGNELWVTDGTAEGTRLAADLQPGPLSGNPHSYAAAGERLFFAASSPAVGVELWALPLAVTPRLAIDDVRLTEGDAAAASLARFTITLSSPASREVTVDYATSDGTASAGTDYDAVAGTLTFAPGQTSRTIDVPVHGDAQTEGDETFFVTLRNPSHAVLSKPAGFAVIDDDDQFADVALGFDFSTFNFLDVSVTSTNHGPLTATNLKLAATATPNINPASYCDFACAAAPSKISPNATRTLFAAHSSNVQQYFTATLTARQLDTQPTNNSVGWTVNNGLALEAVNLAPGTSATAWFLHTKIGTATTTPTTVNVESSSSSVLTVPATITVPGDTHMTSFPVHAVAAGTATIRVSNSAGTITSLIVDVVPPGTKVRWPGAISGFCNSQVSFDRESPIQVYPAGKVPYTGAIATGVVRVTLNGQELGRLTLPADGTQVTLPVYSPIVGQQPVKLEYDGDANFLPMSIDLNLYTTIGVVTTTTSADRSGPNATLHIRVAGSPAAAPGGTITVSEPGVIAPKQVPLTAGPGGISRADVALTNLAPGTHTLVLTYSGDSRYYANTQNARLLDAHRRAVGH